MSTPNHLKSEAHSILTEIPYTFIQLANDDDSREFRDYFVTSLRVVHRWIAEAFGEPRPANLGVLAIADDLTRWSSVWTWHPYAEQWVAQLRQIVRVVNERTEQVA